MRMDIALVKVLGDIDIRCAFSECLFVCKNIWHSIIRSFKQILNKKSNQDRITLTNTDY